MRNVLVSNQTPLTVAASKSAFPLSSQFILRQDWIRVGIFVSSITRSTAFTLSLQHSADNSTWNNVGSEATITIPAAKTAASASDINTSTEVITSTSHGFLNGQAVVFMAGTAAPGGLVTATVYYIILASANTFKLAATQLDAFNGTAINITSTGTGTQSFYPALHEIRLVPNDSSDYAQMPIYDNCRIVADTGSGDGLVVTGIFVP